MKIGLSRVHFPVTTLGPGERVGIWFQGCSIRCPGCISADTWRPAIDSVEVSKLIKSITPWLDMCDGITISGGEPFDQPDGLLALLREIKSQGDHNVLVYSGYSLEKLTPLLSSNCELIDALVTDPFEIDTPQTKPLRGSDNQQLHLLTARGKSLFSIYEREKRIDDRQFDISFDADGTIWLAGIPARNDMKRLQRLLAAEGHISLISEAPLPKKEK